MSSSTSVGRPSRRTASAFTLIELLVVIAIIAILAAILFPVFAQAREKARQTACLSNEKQLGLAIQQYIQDNDEYLPYAINGSSTIPYITWDVALFPYTKSAGVYVCPSMKTPRNLSHGVYPVSYITNQRVMVANTSGTTKDYLLSHFDAPASDITMVETDFGKSGTNNATNYQSFAFCDSNNNNDTLAAIMDPTPTNATNNRLAYQRHNGGANYVFLDGHAKWYLLQNTVNPWLYAACSGPVG